MTTDQHRFREMTLFIAHETEGDRSCGATKLTQILFYADFRAYEPLRKSDLSLFSAPEIELVRRVIRELVPFERHRGKQPLAPLRGLAGH